MVGKELLGTRYVSNTLGGAPEALRANLDSLDCVTFVDQTISIARCIKESDSSVNGFLNRLKKFRYKNGELEDVTSRLHYATEILFEKEQDKTWQDIGKELGGEIYAQKLIPQLYVMALKNNMGQK